MFSWDFEKIGFFRDAAEYGSFNEALAARAAKCFSPAAHICDAGCGLGYVSIALSTCVGRVTAIDTSADALRVLEDGIAKRGARNIDAVCADVFGLADGVTFDGSVFCFFAGAKDILGFARRHCHGKTVIFKKNWASHRFTVRETPIRAFTYDMTLAELDALGVPYECETFSLDMGQPFRSVADARRFFILHDRNGDADISEDEVLRRVIATGSAEFPLYLPAENPVGMIVIDSRDIPASI